MRVFPSSLQEHSVTDGIISFASDDDDLAEIYFKHDDIVSVAFTTQKTDTAVIHHCVPEEMVAEVPFGRRNSRKSFVETSQEELIEMAEKIFIDYANALMNRRILGGRNG